MRRARIRLGLTLAEVARRCTDLGVPLSESQASRIERGEHAGRPETRAALAQVLGLDAFEDFEAPSMSPMPPRQPMIICPHCGAENDPARGNNRCRNCQLPLTPTPGLVEQQGA